MKKQLLKNISAFIVTTMIFSASANAQIIYTDVDPDVVKTCSISSAGSCSETDSVDINNDGVFDLGLNLVSNRVSNPRGYTLSGSVRATPLNGSEIITDTAGYPYPLYMQMNDVISASCSTSTVLGLILISRSRTQVVGSGTATGNWTSTTDGFLGLKVVSGGQSYYCWIRMNVEVVTGTPTSATFTIKDYAYNSIPNEPILAGQTFATGIIGNSLASSINIFPNPATNHFTIDLGSNYKKVEVSIADITGKVVPIAIGNSTSANGTDSPDSYRDRDREQKIEVNTQDFAKGIYIVQIQTADFIETKKLVIEK